MLFCFYATAGIKSGGWGTQIHWMAFKITTQKMRISKIYLTQLITAIHVGYGL